MTALTAKWLAGEGMWVVNAQAHRGRQLSAQIAWSDHPAGLVQQAFADAPAGQQVTVYAQVDHL